MYPNFLPPDVNQLSETTSIDLARSIQLQALSTPLLEQAIPTAYVRQGEGGVPVLLLHGFDSSLLEFRRLLPLLAAEQETWSLDLLGFGFTERSEGLTFSPLEIKTHLFSFVQANIKHPVILVGASMGGAVAIDFALTYPDWVQELVLLDSAGLGPTPVPTKLMVPPIDRWATSFLGHPLVRRRVSLQAYCDRQWVTPDAERCSSLHLQCPRWQQALIGFAKSGGYTLHPDQIAQISQPTLILWGEQDRILKPADAHQFAAAIANSQLIWIPDCGHIPHLEKPQLTRQHILAFHAQNQVLVH